MGSPSRSPTSRARERDRDGSHRESGGAGRAARYFALTRPTAVSFNCTNLDGLHRWLGACGFHAGRAMDGERYRLVSTGGAMVACLHGSGLVTCEGRDAAELARLLADSEAQERWFATVKNVRGYVHIVRRALGRTIIIVAILAAWRGLLHRARHAPCGMDRAQRARNGVPRDGGTSETTGRIIEP